MTNPRVSIIHATGMSAAFGLKDEDGLLPSIEPKYAAALLAFTKNTRLQMSPSGFQEWLNKPAEEIKTELDYMVNTIRSSWEFVDVIFMIEDVSRACAQQITRSRLASFAMQSQRVTDMSTAGHHIPERVENNQRKLEVYEDAMAMSKQFYAGMVQEEGFELEDARGILPINLHCNLVAKYNLRVLVDLVLARTSSRAQGEYQSVAEQMKRKTIEIWPWAENFFRPKNELAVSLIHQVIEDLHDGDARRNLAKAADMLK